MEHITPDALINRLNARDRHVPGKFILSDRSEHQLGRAPVTAPGQFFAPDHQAASDQFQPFHRTLV